MKYYRKYMALRGRAEDQKGTPEGELCAKLAEKLCEKYPEMVDGMEDDEHLPTSDVEMRWKHEFERSLLLRVADYLDEKAYVNRLHPRRKVLVFLVDGPTACLLEQAYETCRAQLGKLLVYVQAGFHHGALPIPYEDDDESDAERPPIDPGLAEAAFAAAMYGRGKQPRKALGPGRAG